MARSLRIPRNWNEVTIGQFQAIHALPKQDKYEANLSVLSILTGIDRDGLEERTRGEILSAIKKTEWMEVLPDKEQKTPFTKGNHIYYFVLHPNEMNGGDYTDITHFSGDAIENLHNICAKLTTHYKLVPKQKITGDFQQRAELFKNNMPFGLAYGYLLFFSTYYPALRKISLSYLEGIREALESPIH